MKIIRLSSTNSTNVALKKLIKKNAFIEPTAIIAQTQTHGRGQMGTSWQDTPDDSVLLSVAFFPKALHVSQQFYVSMAAACGVRATLNQFDINAQIKWPNDCYCNGRKIAGILIENQLVGTAIQNVVIGVGVNVNQRIFPNLPFATSVYMETNQRVPVDALAVSCIEAIAFYMEWIKAQRWTLVKKHYLENSIGWQQPQVFLLPNGEKKRGRVLDVSPNGRLQLAFETGEIVDFGLKEIQWELPLR